MSRELILEEIEGLPEESRRQLLAFLEFLSGQASGPAQASPAPGFKFNWAGGLADLGKEHSAVELQHQASE
jgi:hypothetical protein